MSEPADVLILGGGSGGYAAAFRAAQLGLSVTLVEQDKLGGTCLHRGCIPTKALLHCAEIADSARGAEQFGVQASLEGIDMAQVQKFSAGIVDRLHNGLHGLVRANGVRLIQGRGSLVDARTVEVDGTRYTGEAVVLATGSQPKTLPGLDPSGPIVTSEQALLLEHVPDRVCVLGGGAIGVEFASAWASFGAAVTIVEALPRLLPAEDEFSSKQLERALGRRKVDCKTGVRFAGARAGASGVSVELDTGETVEADLVLVAVGRAANTGGHGFAEAGVAMAEGFVTTDERMRTTVAGVYAVGDVVAGFQLAHRGFAQGMFVAEDIAGQAPAPTDEAGIPRVTYSRPEVASVGLSEHDARHRYGAEVSVLHYDLAGNGKSQILRTSGALKVVRAPDGPVLGLHLVGDRVSELIGEAQLIYNWEAFPEDVAPLVHPHPTQTEALGEAHLALAGKPLHVHG